MIPLSTFNSDLIDVVLCKKKEKTIIFSPRSFSNVHASGLCLKPQEEEGEPYLPGNDYAMTVHVSSKQYSSEYLQEHKLNILNCA